MKKLMILTAALATGVMAYGELRNKFDASTAEDLTGWVVPEGEGKATLDTEKDVLKLATGSEAARRLVQPSGEAFEMGNNIYFDVTLDVLGQALDEVPVLPSDAQLALFLLDTTEIEGAPAGTNLYAIARNPDGSDSKVLVRFTGGVESLLIGQSRLTVKTYKNVMKNGNHGGFTVYQDGSDSGTVDPLRISACYLISEDGSTETVEWGRNKYDAQYLSDKLISSLETKRSSVLLNLRSGVYGQRFTAMDFTGNAEIATVEMNDTGFGFIAPDEIKTMITYSGVTLKVTMDDGETGSYDPATGVISGSATIKVTLDEGFEILDYTEADYLVKQADDTFKYTYAEGNNVTFAAYAAGAKVVIGGVTTKYKSLSEALETINTSESAAAVTLLADEKISTYLMGNGNLTLDLNGKILTGTGNADEEIFAVVYVSTGSAKIYDSVGGGAIVANGSDVSTVLCEYGAKVEIASGTFRGVMKDNNLGPEAEEQTPGITVTGGSFTQDPKAFVDLTKYSVKYADGLYKVTEGASSDVVEPTKPVTVDSLEAAEALMISAPSPDEDVVSSEAYTLYFTKKITEQTDAETGAVTYSVEAVLNKDAVSPDEVAKEIVGTFDDIETNGGVAVTTAKPGLYYSVEQGQTLDNMNEGKRVMAKGTTVTIPAEKYEGSGFYRVLVNITDKQQ